VDSNCTFAATVRFSASLTPIVRPSGGSARVFDLERFVRVEFHCEAALCILEIIVNHLERVPPYC